MIKMPNISYDFNAFLYPITKIQMNQSPATGKELAALFLPIHAIEFAR